MEDAGAVVYKIGGNDEIVSVNREWDRFAAANSGENLVSGSILFRSLWDFISDVSTRELYRVVLKNVRAGRRARFPFRCDSADCRRFLEMDASPADGSEIQFIVRTIRLEKRAPVTLLQSARPRSDALLNMCGWCKRVKVGALWLEAEDAVAALALFESVPLPLLTHGMCEECGEKTASTLTAPPVVL